MFLSKPKKLFSIIVVTHGNRSKELERSLRSVFKSNFKDYDCIVVDNNSSNESKIILKKYKNKIKLIVNENNKRLANARNQGIKIANSEYIIFLDDDDQLMPNSLEVWQEEIETNGSLIIYGGVRKIEGKKIVDVIPRQPGDIWLLLRDGWAPPVGAQCFKKNILVDVGFLDIDLLSGIDHDLWMKLALHGHKTSIVNKPVCIPETKDKDRMTLNPTERIMGIKQFLNKWESFIVSKEGKPFFDKYSKAYIAREYIKFALNFNGIKSFLFFLKSFFAMPSNFSYIKLYINKFIRIGTPTIDYQKVFMENAITIKK